MERHVRHLEQYYLRKQELILVYPHVLTLDFVESIASIRDWVNDTHVDCLWHAFLYRNFNFDIGYDFFFREGPHAAMFKLAWGGRVEDDLPNMKVGFFLGECWLP